MFTLCMKIGTVISNDTTVTAHILPCILCLCARASHDIAQMIKMLYNDINTECGQKASSVSRCVFNVERK